MCKSKDAPPRPSQNTKQSQANHNRIVDQSAGAAFMQFNWASFGLGVSSILIIAIVLVFLYVCYRHNKRANKKAHRAELHELVMLATRNGPHRSTKLSPPTAEYPPEIHTPQRPTVVNPMYARPTIELPPTYLPGGPIISSDGVQFSRLGFPGINHTQIPAISYV